LRIENTPEKKFHEIFEEFLQQNIFSRFTRYTVSAIFDKQCDEKMYFPLSNRTNTVENSKIELCNIRMVVR